MLSRAVSSPRCAARAGGAASVRPLPPVRTASAAATAAAAAAPVQFVMLPKSAVRGPRPEAELQEAVAQAEGWLAQGKPAVLTSFATNKYLHYELFLVLSALFAKHKDVELRVSKYERKPQEEQPEGKVVPNPRSFYRLTVTPAPAATSTTTPAPTEGQQQGPRLLGVGKDADQTAFGIRIADALSRGEQLSVAGLGPYAVSAMLGAVQRATVRARTLHRQQLVITSVSRQVLDRPRNPPSTDAAQPAAAQKQPHPLGPPQSVVLALSLRPLPPIDETTTASSPGAAAGSENKPAARRQRGGAGKRSATKRSEGSEQKDPSNPAAAPATPPAPVAAAATPAAPAAANA